MNAGRPAVEKGALVAWVHQTVTGVRVAWEPDDGLEEVRAGVRRVAWGLRSVRADLLGYAAAIPAPTPSEGELQAVLSGRRPPGPAILLAGAIDHTIAAHLQPAFCDLEDALEERDHGPRAPRIEVEGGGGA